jgi:hypothetical protein
MSMRVCEFFSVASYLLKFALKIINEAGGAMHQERALGEAEVRIESMMTAGLLRFWPELKIVVEQYRDVMTEEDQQAINCIWKNSFEEVTFQLCGVLTSQVIGLPAGRLPRGGLRYLDQIPGPQGWRPWRHGRTVLADLANRQRHSLADRHRGALHPPGQQARLPPDPLYGQG